VPLKRTCVGLGLGRVVLVDPDDNVDQMITDALTSPKSKGAASSPIDFYIPEQSPDSHWQLPH
jgi:hypothetical protein